MKNFVQALIKEKQYDKENTLHCNASEQETLAHVVQHKVLRIAACFIIVILALKIKNKSIAISSS